NSRFIRLRDVQPGPPPSAPPIGSSVPAGISSLAIGDNEEPRGSIIRLTHFEAAATGSGGIAVWNAANLSRDPQLLLAFDATKSTAPAPIRLPVSQHIFDIEPDRGLVIVGDKDGPFVRAEHLTVSRVAGAKVTPLFRWSPYPDATIGGKQVSDSEVEGAWFLSGSRVLTKSRVGRVWTVWRLTEQRAIAEIDFFTDHVAFADVCVRRDGSVVAISTTGKISLLDVAKGQVIRQLPFRGVGRNPLKFSDDGRKLAAARPGELRVWDLATGEVAQEMWHAAVRSSKRIDWVGDNLLIDGNLLFDMKHRVLLWEYRGGRHGVAFERGRLWSIEGMYPSGPAQMTGVPVPHEEALQVIARLENDAGLTAASSGDQIGLKISVPSSHATQFQVVAIVSERLRTAGYEIVYDETPALMMVVTATPMKAEDVEVYERGELHLFGKKPVIRKFVPHLWSCDLQLNGESIHRQAVLWGSGGRIEMRLNDSPDAAIARSQKAEVSRVLPASFPTRVSRQGSATPSGAYGISRVTAEGVQSLDGNR
ncbi:MAG: WD40 repeat domain-containing protein, partial [Planctomycetota bacterium]